MNQLPDASCPRCGWPMRGWEDLYYSYQCGSCGFEISFEKSLTKDPRLKEEADQIERVRQAIEALPASDNGASQPSEAEPV